MDVRSGIQMKIKKGLGNVVSSFRSVDVEVRVRGGPDCRFRTPFSEWLWGTRVSHRVSPSPRLVSEAVGAAAAWPIRTAVRTEQRRDCRRLHGPTTAGARETCAGPPRGGPRGEQTGGAGRASKGLSGAGPSSASRRLGVLPSK